MSVLLSLVLLAAAPAKLPPERLAELGRLATSDDEMKIRLQAVVVLGRSGDRGAEPFLRAATTDEQPAVRGAAAIALGHLEDPSAVEAIAPLADDEEAVVREVALRALSELSTAAAPASIPYLVSARQRLGRHAREAIVLALAGLDYPAARSGLAEALGDDDGLVRAAAEHALLSGPPLPASLALRGALDSQNYRVRAAAADLLGRLTEIDDSAFARLTVALVDDSEVPEVQTAARAAIAARRERLDAPALAATASGADAKADRYARARAATLLSVLADDRAYAALVKALSDDEPLVRGAAASALASMGDARAVGPLSRLERSEPDARVKRIARSALERLTH